MNPFETPYIIPLGAFLVAIVAIVSGAVSQAHARRIKAEQRMSMLQRGMTVEQIDQLFPADLIQRLHQGFVGLSKILGSYGAQVPCFQ